MKNHLVSTLRDLFEDVHNGNMGRQVALEKFCFMFNGYNYIPKHPISKKDKIIGMLKCGYEPKDIAKRLKTQTGYVKRIKKEI